MLLNIKPSLQPLAIVILYAISDMLAGSDKTVY